VPNRAADMNSRARLACYPRGTLYPLSDGPSTRDRRITKPWFPTCSACRPHSQPPFCLYTQQAVPSALRGALGASVTFQEATAPVRLATRQCPSLGSTKEVRSPICQGWYFTDGSTRTGARASQPPTYSTHDIPDSNARLQ